MSELQFDFEIIHKINELKEIKKEEILQLLKEIPKETIFDTASNLRNERKDKNVIHSDNETETLATMSQQELLNVVKRYWN